MSLFNISKKKTIKTNTLGEPLDKLVSGELPFGWIANHRDFTEKISSQHNYFLHLWLNSRQNSPKEQYSSLKSFVLFLNDCKKLCASQGECYIKWFNDCIADDTYIQERTKELELLSSNFSNLTKAYDTKAKSLPNIDKQILQYVRSHPGILQKDLYNSFNPNLKNDISERIYYLSKNGKIKRTKQGNTYKLYI